MARFKRELECKIGASISSEWSTCFAAIFLSLFLTSAGMAGPKAPHSRFVLHSDWRLQSSCKVRSTAQEISSLGFGVSDWHRARVPTTVVAALVADKTLPDPDFGMNLRSFPGMNYPIGALFANLPMPQDSPFRCSWWYRREFKFPSDTQGTTWLNFDGINYRANIWLNGRKVADAENVAGTFRHFEFDVSKLVHTGQLNVLAVEVFPPSEKDLAISWVDWNPMPPDKAMGLWKDVYITTTGDVSLRRPFVSTRLSPDHKSAKLNISAELRNTLSRPVTGNLQVELEGIRITEVVDLGPAASKTVVLDPSRYPQLTVKNPRLWWPYQMGTPNLYSIKLRFEVNGRLSDTAGLRFGIRDVQMEHNAEGDRLLVINGRKVLIRGAGWTPDMLLRWSSERTAAELNYVKDLGLNTIRLEGKLERDEFFDLADQMGILVMPGWCCCDMWERWSEWQAEQYRIAGASLADELRRLRNHPSVFVWVYGSDNPPPADVEKMYLRILDEQHWPNPYLSSASQKPSAITGPSGVKMLGPYDYVPPNYWLTDHDAGGAFGFNTETSPGPAIPPFESLKRFLPQDHLWPVDDVWNYHAGGLRFRNITVFRNALNERYGEPKDLDDFLRKSQAMSYEAERAMFEAYTRNRYLSTGVIQWMLNNAWPSLIWHLYDYYLTPAGGYFGTKKACELVHVQYSYDDRSIVAVNGHDETISKVRVTAAVYDLEGTPKLRHEAIIDLPADSNTRAFVIPELTGLSPTYFLKLTLTDANRRVLSTNFYWLSTTPDVLDWANRKTTAYTPQLNYANMRGLEKLRPVQLLVSSRTEMHGRTSMARIHLENNSSSVAFMIRLDITAPDGDGVRPIFWDDNYFSLLPGEKREITARYDASGGGAQLRTTGWNIVPHTISLTQAPNHHPAPR